MFQALLEDRFSERARLTLSEAPSDPPVTHDTAVNTTSVAQLANLRENRLNSGINSQNCEGGKEF